MGEELHADVLLRGPYLQTATPDSIAIRWRTDVETASLVCYGSQTNDLSFSAGDLGLTNEHAVRLSGLIPGTTYFYSIGSLTETLAGGADCCFVTSPAPGQTGSTRVWVIGDSGGFAICCSAAVSAMRDAYAVYTGARRTDVWLALGDNAYNSGTDPEYQTDFFDVFPSILRQVAPWPTVGNHETYSATAGGWFPYLSIFSFLTNGEAGGVASRTARYYSFDYASIHFICLDSMTQSRATNGAMANWLSMDLEATTNQWIIAFWHHPPYSKGNHDSDDLGGETEMREMRQNILPMLEARGVDLVLCGHSHNYERSYLLRGHYDKSATLQPAMILDHGSGRESDTGAYIKPTAGPLADQGTVYVVLGNSASYEAPRIGHHPAMFTDDLSVGSVALDINSNRLDAVFLRETGIIADSFTIIKGDPEPLRLCTFVLRDGNTVARWKSVGGQAYRVERCGNLQPPDWQPVSDPILAIGATTSWTNAITPGATPNFYRVTQLTP